MRVAGTPEARRAWFMLRGPFLLAYLGMAAYAIADFLDDTGEYLWQGVILLIALNLIIGSVASGLVVSKRLHSERCQRVEVMEVTGLKALWIFEYGYALWALFDPPFGNDAAFAHFVIGSFAVGILVNMTWLKGAHHVQ